LNPGVELLIRVDEVSRYFGDFKAVDGVSFAAGKGEIVGLLGHNGAGKTTIMKMLTGYLEPDAGRIQIVGLDLASQADRCQASIGYLPENLPLYPEMLVLEYLQYTASMRDLRGEQAIEAVRSVIARTELQDKALQRIATLSRGYKQRLGVAQAILHKPEVLILDEPTNGLDPRQTQHMRALILELAREATVILSTHIMQEVDAVCDRVLMLNAGRLVLDQSLDGLRRSQELLLLTDRDVLPPAAAGLLAQGSTCLSVTGGKYLHSIELPGGADADELVRDLTVALVGAGAAVYSIAPRSRDLETVFREANEAAQEVVDAA
jgi:ABC-2 type transport system ATP-binding protein